MIAASARTGEGIPELWELVLAHRAALTASGELEARRQIQARDWMWSLVQEGLERAFRGHPAVAQRIPSLQSGAVDIVAHTMTINCGRWQAVAFSTQYFDSGQKVLVRRNIEADSYLDLGGRYVWAPGYWEVRRSGWVWEPAHWQFWGGHWRYVPGHWRR